MRTRQPHAAGGLGVNFGDFATFDLRASQVYSNTAYQGGGIYFQTATPLTFGLPSVRIENTSIYSNTASLSAGFENHSGSAAVPIELLNSNLHNNRAAGYGGRNWQLRRLCMLYHHTDANYSRSSGWGPVRLRRRYSRRRAKYAQREYGADWRRHLLRIFHSSTPLRLR